jgi:cation diffusion facilitator family transporter
MTGETHDHESEHDHGHDHGDSRLARLRHALWHSHGTADAVDDTMLSNARGIWALKVSLVALGITAVAQLAIVAVSGSTALLADTIHNLGDALTSVPLWISFALQRRVRERRFTYGLGRTEDLAGVIIVMVIFFSACVAGYEALDRLLNPRPITNLGWVAAAGLIGFLGNEAVAVFRMRVGREIGSAALVADGQHSRVDGLTSLAVVAGAAGVWFGYPALDPLVGLGIAVTIMLIVFSTGKQVLLRLLDGIEPEILAAVEHAPLHVAGVMGVHEVRARWLGHRVHADLHVTVAPELSVQESHRIVDAVLAELAQHLPTFGGAVVHVCPAETAS